jgi:hypothetical protein
MINQFYEAAVNHMAIQLAYLEKAIGRSITDEEKENLGEFVRGLDRKTREDFEEKLGSILCE